MGGQSGVGVGGIRLIDGVRRRGRKQRGEQRMIWRGGGGRKQKAEHGGEVE